MIHVLVEAVKSINNVVDEKRKFIKLLKKRKRVTVMVALDQMKSEIQAYETPLAEVRDSL